VTSPSDHCASSSSLVSTSRCADFLLLYLASYQPRCDNSKGSRFCLKKSQVYERKRRHSSLISVLPEPTVGRGCTDDQGENQIALFALTGYTFTSIGHNQGSIMIQ
jgi:hypothetical protein